MITILRDKEITDKLVFLAEDDGEPIGSIICTTDGETLFVEKIETQYIMLVDGLMRTAMNYALNRYINKCTVNMQSEAVWSELIKRGFVQNNNNNIADIDNFFTSHKSCKNQRNPLVIMAKMSYNYT